MCRLIKSSHPKWDIAPKLPAALPPNVQQGRFTPYCLPVFSLPFHPLIVPPLEASWWMGVSTSPSSAQSSPLAKTRVFGGPPSLETPSSSPQWGAQEQFGDRANPLCCFSALLHIPRLRAWHFSLPSTKDFHVPLGMLRIPSRTGGDCAHALGIAQIPILTLSFT